jgi:hypothetical protein
VAISLGKRVSLEILRKISFQVLGGQSGPLGRTVRGFLIFILYVRFLAKVFEKMRFQADSPRASCGRSVILFRTEPNRVQLGGPGGRSAICPRIVRGAQADGSRGPGGRSARPNSQSCQPLTSRFTVGIQMQTVREVRVFPITASNGKGEYIYSKPGIGETLLALWKVHTPL